MMMIWSILLLPFFVIVILLSDFALRDGLTPPHTRPPPTYLMVSFSFFFARLTLDYDYMYVKQI